jgi:hypothetical protein
VAPPLRSSAMSDGDDFDLLAASLRADASDLDAFVEALATKLEVSFPERVRVERKGGRLGGRRRVARVTVTLDDRSFELEREQAAISCRRRNVVRGIALKNDELTIDEWIDDLSRRLAKVAGETERGRAALQRLLEG